MQTISVLDTVHQYFRVVYFKYFFELLAAHFAVNGQRWRYRNFQHFVFAIETVHLQRGCSREATHGDSVVHITEKLIHECARIVTAIIGDILQVVTGISLGIGVPTDLRTCYWRISIEFVIGRNAGRTLRKRKSGIVSAEEAVGRAREAVAIRMRKVARLAL